MLNIKSSIRNWLMSKRVLNKSFVDEGTQEIVHQFENTLGENLYSLIQYGSSVTGDADQLSDLNLLIVLNLSTPEAHKAIHDIIVSHPFIEPFIMGKRGLDKTMHCFAIKFLSISRRYKLLSGYDFLPEFDISVQHERFLAEQALRNLRLRIVQSYAKRGASPTYLRFIASQLTSIFIDIAEVLRCQKITMPENRLERIPIFEETFGFDFSVLNEVVLLKSKSRNITSQHAQWVHRNLFILIDNILMFIESNWHE